MALSSVEDMVKERLSFVPQTGWETRIEAFKLEQMYFLQSYFDIDDSNVEDDASFTGLRRVLLAELTTYQLIIRKIISTTGGESDSESTGEGSKMIKSAKADVVEAEFEYAKADDGRTISMKTEKLLPELKTSICSYAQTLGIRLPGYCPDKKGLPPPFKAFVKE